MSVSKYCMLAIAAAIAVGPILGVGAQASADRRRVAVFVPGVVSGSPIYEQLVKGAERAVSESKGASLKVVEAGNNQAVWLDSLAALASTGAYDLVVTSNPSLPELCAQVSASFPRLRFLVADGYLEGNSAIHTVLYNQLDEGYIVGYLAGLATGGRIPGSPASHLAGMVIAQHYPTMDRMIIPGFERGLKAADPAARLELRVVGNWYDATKASELASGLFDAGASVILPIAGGASRGVVSAAKAADRKVLCFDDASGYTTTPGTVIGCAVLEQEKLVYERLKTLLDEGRESSLYGTADIVGAREGYVDFDASGASYQALPAASRAALELVVAKLKSGELSLEVPEL